jgi:putative colanic acid biosynthesis UDP-glucose lipid carrier transferase
MYEFVRLSHGRVSEHAYNRVPGRVPSRRRALRVGDLPNPNARQGAGRGKKSYGDSLQKRFLDIFLATLCLALTWPLFLVLSLAIKLDSSGPIFFRQERTGLRGRKFIIVKFRTMTVLESGLSAVACAGNDPRVTRIGRFIRRMRLDELPQLFNVLLGDMAIVGPRPHPLGLDLRFAKQLPLYENRFLVKPGITGLAQVRGFVGSIDSAESLSRRIFADLEYLKRQSLWLDLCVFLWTLPAVFGRTGLPTPRISPALEARVHLQPRPYPLRRSENWSLGQR